MTLIPTDAVVALRKAVRRRLGFSEAASRDVDAEQALIRVFLGGGILLYATYVAVTSREIGTSLALVMFAAAIPLSAGTLMLRWFRKHSDRPVSMRYVAIFADLVPLTVGLWGADEYGVPLIGLYLWVTVGNGFRFGPRMLMFSYWVANLSFLCLLLFGPFWQSHRSIGIGFALILASIPLYVLVLLSRLTAQKDAALELSNAKSRFVANVSHELRTPLTGVYAVHELLRRRKLAPDERSLVASLGQAISALKVSVDAVLQMSKLEAGAERTDPRPFNLIYFLLQTKYQFEPSATNKGLEWAVRVDDAVPVVVFGDPVHLQHILGNLLNNAFKFTHKGAVTLYVVPSARGVRFEVVDSGIGIAKEKQATLFDRFVQADATATRRYGGTGLGTSIAHDLTLLMGGTISIDSALGRGTRIHVDLPLASNFDTVAADTSINTRLLVFGSRLEARGLEEALQALRANYEILEDEGFDRQDTGSVGFLLGMERVLRHSTHASVHGTPLLPRLLLDRVARMTPSQLMAMGLAATIVDPSPRVIFQHLLALANTIALFSGVSDPVRVQESGPFTVLLADDNRSNQVLLARILEGVGHRVFSAGRGDEAYEVLTTETVDLAILDLNMPEMSGHDVVRLFRAGESGTGRKLPIVILSADATPDAREQSLAAGADEFLTKPVVADDLLAAISRLMAGSAAREDSAGAGVAPAVLTPLNMVEAPTNVAKPAAAPDLIDTERIDALRRIASDDRVFLQRYITASFEDLESAIRELRDAARVGSAPAMRDGLHKIDGTAASLGAIALLNSAKAMRSSLAHVDNASLHVDALAELSTLCALTKSALVASLQDVGTYR